MAVKRLEILQRKLAIMPQAVKTAARAALEEAANATVEMQKRLCPVDTGALRDSIRWTNGAHELKIQIVAGGQETTREVRKGSSKPYNYALAVEHGTSKMDRKPFFFPAYRALKKPNKARISRAGRKAIRQIAAGAPATA